MDKKYITFELNKKKGYRGYFVVAETMIDTKGNQITKEQNDNTEVIVLNSEMQIPNKNIPHDAQDRLIHALTQEALKFKPLYEI
jgi:hypothetical protein